jgi:hypothetical protein
VLCNWCGRPLAAAENDRRFRCRRCPRRQRGRAVFEAISGRGGTGRRPQRPASACEQRHALGLSAGERREFLIRGGAQGPPELAWFPGYVPLALAIGALALTRPSAVVFSYVIGLLLAFDLSLGSDRHRLSASGTRCSTAIAAMSRRPASPGGNGSPRPRRGLRLHDGWAAATVFQLTAP